MNFRGIKTDEINKVLTTYVSDISDIEANLPLLNEKTDRLSDIFANNELENMSTNVQNISNGMQDIVKILNNYNDVLKQMILSYQNEEELVSSEVRIVTDN